MKPRTIIRAARSDSRQRFNSQLEQFETAARIMRFICSDFRITQAHLEGPCRSERLVVPRWIAIYFIRRYTLLSTSQIGLLFERDHTTIVVALKRFEIRRQKSCSFGRLVAELQNRLVAIHPLIPLRALCPSAASLAQKNAHAWVTGITEGD